MEANCGGGTYWAKKKKKVAPVIDDVLQSSFRSGTITRKTEKQGEKTEHLLIN